MKFKVKTGENPKNYPMTALAIEPSTSEIVAVCDDKTLTRFNSEGERLSDTDIDSFVTSMSWLPSPGKANPDVIAAACSDGTVLLMKRNGSVEKSFKAHEHGASTCARWSSDGSSLASSGEDGDVKIWSRSGHLRTKLATYAHPVLAMSWGGNDDSLVVASKNVLNIHSIHGRWKPIHWEAHLKEHGVILAVDWSSANGLIVCGGEDCCFRIFDSFGMPLFASAPDKNAITSLAWSPDGKVFAVGSFNTLLLCDQNGWTHYRESVDVGSVLDMEWCIDGTQLAGACGKGGVILADVVGKKAECGGFVAQKVEPNRLVITGSTSSGTDYEEEIEVSREPIVEFAMAFNQLVVCNKSSCYIFSVPDVSSPCVVDLKGSPAHLLALSAVNFAIVGADSGLVIYTYDGHYLSTPRLQGFRPENLTEEKISMSPDLGAIIDQVNSKIVRLFDTTNGKILEDIIHETEVTMISLSPRGSIQKGRQIAFVDQKRELFVCATMSPSTSWRKQKLATHVTSIAWNNQCDILAAIADSNLITFFYANALCFDKDLLELASERKERTDLARIVTFNDSALSILKVDGAVLTETISSFPAALHQLVDSGKWEESLRICRFANSPQLWATLTGLSRQLKEMDLVENWDIFRMTPASV